MRPAVSVYLHIPFCRYRCDYCDFFARSGVASYRIREILGAIQRQLGYQLKKVDPGAVPTVYLGGGTPSSIGAEEIGGFISHVLAMIGEATAGPDGKTLSGPKEVTVEVNPEDVTESLLDQLTAAGVNRLSVGVQSLHQSALTAMGRHVTREATESGLSTIVSHWGASWNGDLIVAVPGDSSDRVNRDLERLIDCGPDHISIYELTVEPATRLARLVDRGARSLPPVPLREDLFENARSQLLAAGFHHYEISNFARPGCQSRHSLVYWRMQPHIGVGPGAVGTVPVAAGSPHNREGAAVRVENVQGFVPYLTGPDFGMSADALGAVDLFFEYLMMGFRTEEGVSRTDVRAVFGTDPLDLVPGTCETWSRHLILSSDRAALDWEGRRLLNRFLVECRAELDHTATRLSAYRWPAPEG